MRQLPPGNRSLRAMRRQAARPRMPDELREPSDFGTRDALAERRKAIVASSLVVGARPSLFDLDDETLLHHPRDGAIQGARAQPKLPVGSCLDVLDDRVAMSLTLGQREQDVQSRRWQREEIVGNGIRAHRAL